MLEIGSAECIHECRAECRSGVFGFFDKSDDSARLVESRITELADVFEIADIIESYGVSSCFEALENAAKVIFEEIVPSDDQEIFIDRIVIEYILDISE